MNLGVVGGRVERVVNKRHDGCVHGRLEGVERPHCFAFGDVVGDEEMAQNRCVHVHLQAEEA